MRAAIVIAAGMAFAVVMVVMITFCKRIVNEVACCKSFSRFVSVAFDTAENFDAGLCERHLCAAADAAADQCINTESCEHTCESAVTAAERINNFRENDLAVFCGVELELFGVAEMLEDLAVFVCYCDFHM